MDPVELLPLVVPLLPDGPVAVEDPTLADALGALADAGREVRLGPLDEQPDGHCATVLLLSGEVAGAGIRGATLLAEAVRVCRSGGVVAIAAPSAVPARLRGDDGSAPGLPSGDLTHSMAERGLDLLLVAAPGAAAAVAGRAWAGVADLDDDRLPGLLDAGPMVLVVGRTPRSSQERTTHFFASISRKIVAASVACVDDEGRVLVVFDSFKGRWTLPGGLVDAHESPAAAAVREALEEGGVPVRLERLGGVFAHSYPDRVQLVYQARPTEQVPAPQPIHTHEIDEVRWVTRDEAERMLDADMRRRLTVSLDDPGRTWQW